MSEQIEDSGVDIFNGIARIRLEFLRADLKPPTVILLESHKEGIRLLSSIRQSGDWSAVIGTADLGHKRTMADGSVWMEIKIMDIAIRWPANRIAMPDGTFQHA